MTTHVTRAMYFVVAVYSYSGALELEREVV